MPSLVFGILIVVVTGVEGGGKMWNEFPCRFGPSSNAKLWLRLSALQTRRKEWTDERHHVCSQKYLWNCWRSCREGRGLWMQPTAVLKVFYCHSNSSSSKSAGACFAGAVALSAGATCTFEATHFLSSLRGSSQTRSLQAAIAAN